jgi:hypothetical protein
MGYLSCLLFTRLKGLCKKETEFFLENSVSGQIGLLRIDSQTGSKLDFRTFKLSKAGKSSIARDVLWEHYRLGISIALVIHSFDPTNVQSRTNEPQA